jgi:exodeoxyribonuclease VII small subunit
MTQIKPGKKQPTFGEAYEQLERITEELEGDSIDLDVAIEKFEKGLELAQLLKARLKSAEQRVEKIRQKFDTIESSDETKV